MSTPVHPLAKQPTENTPMIDKQQRARKTLLDHHLAPTKALGQNFLVHHHTAQAIVDAGNIQPSEVVVEVGVGLGALTRPLAARARHVYGFEVDRGIVRMHLENRDLPENVSLIHEDILATDFNALRERCGAKLILLANLPYSITNPFLFKLIDNGHLLDRATVMVQKEVGDRLTASPQTKEYGVPTILLGICATVRQVMLLKPGEFHPRPKIDSVVLAIDFFPKYAPFCPADFSAKDFQLVKNIVRAAFNQRRKTLVNSLNETLLSTIGASHDKAGAKIMLQKVLLDQGLSPRVRPEELTPQQFVALGKALSRLF